MPRRLPVQTSRMEKPLATPNGEEWMTRTQLWKTTDFVIVPLGDWRSFYFATFLFFPIDVGAKCGLSPVLGQQCPLSSTLHPSSPQIFCYRLMSSRRRARDHTSDALRSGSQWFAGCRCHASLYTLANAGPSGIEQFPRRFLGSALGVRVRKWMSILGSWPSSGH